MHKKVGESCILSHDFQVPLSTLGQPIRWFVFRSNDSSVISRTGEFSYVSAESLLCPHSVPGTMADAITADELGDMRRSICIIRMNSDELFLDIDENATVWQIMSVIKQTWNVPKHRQVLSADGAILPRRQALSPGVSCLWLVSREQRCEQCNRELHKGKLCSVCLNVSYCSESCQRLHWRSHRSICRIICQPE